jgi:hypothetical protein
MKHCSNDPHTPGNISRRGRSGLPSEGANRKDQVMAGLSEEQQNDCRQALRSFIDRHGLSNWQSTVNVTQTAPGKFNVKIEIAPPADSGSLPWPIQEIAVTDTSSGVAKEVDAMLELGYQARLQGTQTQ